MAELTGDTGRRPELVDRYVRSTRPVYVAPVTARELREACRAANQAKLRNVSNLGGSEMAPKYPVVRTNESLTDIASRMLENQHLARMAEYLVGAASDHTRSEMEQILDWTQSASVRHGLSEAEVLKQALSTSVVTNSTLLTALMHLSNSGVHVIDTEEQ